MELISVIMPVFNAEKYINLAIKSILGQTYSRFELIIVNDASTDRTAQIVHKFKDARLKIVDNKTRLGVTKCLNIGIKQAKGNWIARMDADDIALPDRLSKQVKYLQDHPKVVAVGGWAEVINESGKKISFKKMPCQYAEIKSAILRFNPMIHPTMMFRKKILTEMGDYNPVFNGAEDYDLFLRLAQKYPIENLTSSLIKLRISTKSITAIRAKYTEYQALRVRIKALKSYGYPLWQIIYLIKPIFSYLIPVSIKNKFINLHAK